MSFDSKDIFGYDTLYESDRKNDTENEYRPLGSGRKSEFALGRAKQKNSADSVGKKTAQKSKVHSSAESVEVRKKTASAGTAKKKHTSAGRHPSSKKTLSSAYADKPPTPKASSKTSPAKKAASSKSAAVHPAAKAKTKVSAEKSRSKPHKKSKVFSGKEMLLFIFLGAVSAGDGLRKTFSSRRSRIIAASLAAVIVLVCLSYGLRSIYTSKTMFADGGKELEETAIQERLITDEQNRDKVTYFLIVGVDKSQNLTDCMWMMCFDNEAHRMNVLQVPRDTYVGEDSNALGKINGVYKSPRSVDWCEKCKREVLQEEMMTGVHTVCGTQITQRTESNINAVIRVINDRLSLPVDHYVLFDFEGFEKVIDALGGVDIFLEKEMKVYPNKNTFITLPAGPNHLDGETALKFMRTRKNYANGDLGRVVGQRRIIKAMLEKVDKMTSIEALKALKAAYGYFKTDMSLEEIRSFIAPVKKCGSDGLFMFELPGEDRWVKPHPSYYICDEKKAAEEINAYMLPYSEKITADDISFPEPEY